MINKIRLIKQAQEIIRIESENPPGNEYKLAVYLKKELQRIGLEVKTYEFAKRRPNIVATLKGKNPKKSLLLTPHIDTVPAGRGWKFNPYSANIVGNRLYGRGATDCKGNLAAGLEAVRSIVEDSVKLNHNLIFAATSDEETGSRLGLESLVKKGILKPTVALVLDSDTFNIIVAQKGLLHIKIKISGKKAHGAYPERGVNAIDLAVKIINRLREYKIKYKGHSLLRPPTMNIGTIHGGDKVNIVADWCEIELDFRFPPGVKPGALLNQIKRIIKGVTRDFKIEICHAQNPCEINRNHALVKALLKASRINKANAKIKGSEGATVISFFLEKGIPAVATGFGTPKMAHVTDEYVKINDLVKGAKFLVDFIKELDNNEAD